LDLAIFCVKPRSSTARHGGACDARSITEMARECTESNRSCFRVERHVTGWVNIWIGLFYFHRTLCRLEERLYLVSNDLPLRAALSGDHAELEISKVFEAPYVLSVMALYP
jgi:hypothetical protein